MTAARVMKEPKFLSRRQIEAQHRALLTLYGGSEGIRSESALESALAAPINDYLYRDADLFGLAASYAFHVAQAQAYFDGNKRTGAACALMFLEVNGVSTDRDLFPLRHTFVAFAEKRLSKAVFARRLRALFERRDAGS